MNLPIIGPRPPCDICGAPATWVCLGDKDNAVLAAGCNEHREQARAKFRQIIAGSLAATYAANRLLAQRLN